MKAYPDGIFEFELFELEDLKNAKEYAEKINGSIYSWKTIGYSNWLEKRLSNVDVLGFVVLPKGMPDWIGLPEDAKEEENGEDETDKE